MSEKTRISVWLNDMDGHTIYDAEKCADDFRKWTGLEPCWPTHSEKATEREMLLRGLGGSLDKNGRPTCYGYEVADHLARVHADHYSIMNGRGSRFRDCLEYLEKAGK